MTISKIYHRIHYSLPTDLAPHGLLASTKGRICLSDATFCSFSNQTPWNIISICLKRVLESQRSFICLWEIEFAENRMETLVGILWGIVKYLQHKNQFIWKQMYKCLASFPVSGIKNVPLLRAAILLTFKEEVTPGRGREWAQKTTVLQTRIVLDEFICCS